MLRRCTCSQKIPSPDRGIREDKIRLTVVFCFLFFFLKKIAKVGRLEKG